MRVGISIGTTYDVRGPGGHRAGPLGVVAQAKAARRAGLASLSVGDHHATGPFGYLQNVPILGRLLAGWDGPAGCLFLVPLWHPVLLAEQVGTLAAMASGPFVIQAGVGGGAEQFAAMGVPLAERGAATEEGIRVVQALLRGETVDSARWGISGARIAPLPPEGTEWWIGGGSPRAIDRAARLGDCWYGNADLTPTSAAELLSVYRDACARHGRTPVRVPIRKDVLITEEGTDARRVGDALVGAGYRGFERTAVAYGSPPEVAEQLAVYGELGYTDVIIRTMEPLDGLAAGAAARSVELAGEVQAILSRP
jgi:alkanesulfonate monooxygenase SsuD/methylene tetrahydromethanopterin reductase-like flavin-dependent oxidoreductase (luciferase family)